MENNSSKLQKLFRPVGKKELELIIESGNQSYPPRLAWQPIFYPVLNYEYARQIAVKWNLGDEFSGYSGFVTEFEISKAFIEKYPVENVGGDIHNELWVPSEKLDEFNKEIEGHIQISGRYYGELYDGKIEKSSFFLNLTGLEQLRKLKELDKEKLPSIVEEEKKTILINWDYWAANVEDDSILKEIKSIWSEKHPGIELRTT